MDAGEAFSGCDEHVGHGAGGEVDHQVVDRVTGDSFDDVERQDVGAHRTESHGQRAEPAGPVLDLNP